MKRTQVVILCLCILLVALLAVLQLRSNVREAELRQELIRQNEIIASGQLALEASRETSSMLEKKLDDLAEALTASASKSEMPPTAEGSINLAIPAQAARAHDTNASVPVAASRQVTSVFVETVLGAQGNMLATNATFSGMVGRRLVFRLPKGPPAAFDVDQLHPDTLAKLGVDPDSARKAQYDLDQMKRAQAEANQKSYQAKLLAIGKLEAAARAERAKAAETERKMQMEYEMRLREAESDRIRAEAQMRSADAAMARALNPDPIYNQYYVPGGVPVVIGQAQPSTPTPSAAPSVPQTSAPPPNTGAGQKGTFKFLPLQPGLKR